MGTLTQSRAKTSQYIRKMKVWYREESVRIWSFFGPYSDRMAENADQNNSEQGHCSRSGGSNMNLINMTDENKHVLCVDEYKRVINI